MNTRYMLDVYSHGRDCDGPIERHSRETVNARDLAERLGFALMSHDTVEVDHPTLPGSTSIRFHRNTDEGYTAVDFTFAEVEEVGP